MSIVRKRNGIRLGPRDDSGLTARGKTGRSDAVWATGEGDFFEGCVRCGDQDHRSRETFGSNGSVFQRGNAANPFRFQVAIYLEPRSWSKPPRWCETTRVEREQWSEGARARSSEAIRRCIVGVDSSEEYWRRGTRENEA